MWRRNTCTSISPPLDAMRRVSIGWGKADSVAGSGGATTSASRVEIDNHDERNRSVYAQTCRNDGIVPFDAAQEDRRTLSSCAARTLPQRVTTRRPGDVPHQ